MNGTAFPSLVDLDQAKDSGDLIMRAGERTDLEGILTLVSAHARQGDMLPVSRAMLVEHIHDFHVVVQHDTLLGCGRLHRWSDGQAEVRSLAVSRRAQGRGIGRRIVGALLSEARREGCPRVFALTLKPTFFVKAGFRTGFVQQFPQKMAHDCLNCARRQHCREIAVYKDIALTHDQPGLTPLSATTKTWRETRWTV